MSENQKPKYRDVGVAYLTRSKKAINLNIDGHTGIVSVQSMENLINGSYSTANISRSE